VEWTTNTRVKTILTQQNAASGATEVRGVRDASGNEFTADVVAVCNGYQSAPLLKTADVFVPVFPLRGYSVTAPAVKRFPAGLQPYTTVFPYRLYIKQYPGQQVRFSCFGEIVPSWQAEQGTEALHQRLEDLIRYVCPNVDEHVDLANGVRWVGSRPLTPDCHAIVGTTRVAGLCVNTGHSFTGWKFCAKTSELMAECAVRGSNEPLGCDQPLYSLERFKLLRKF
jgi:D-amino-acid dehydrogenase